MIKSRHNPKLLLYRSHQVSVDYDAVNGDIGYFSSLPTQLQQASVNRKIEFLAGRFCAEAAIKKVSFLIQPVGIEKDRSPIWPDGLIGSISHTSNFATAAIAHKKDVLGIGIDSEKIMDTETLEATRNVFMFADEYSIGKSSSLTDQELATLVFSAKESIYKCLYPQIHRFLDFKDASILEINERKKQFTFRLNIDLNNDFYVGFTSIGSFDIENGMIHTAVEILREYDASAV